MDDKLSELRELVYEKLEGTEESNEAIASFWIDEDDLFSYTIKGIVECKDREKMKKFLNIF